MLKNFRDMVSASASVVAAAAVSGAANSMQQLSSEAKAAITAAAAAQARQHRLMKMTEQRQMSGAVRQWQHNMCCRWSKHQEVARTFRKNAVLVGSTKQRRQATLLPPAQHTA
jgi:hypothetical protein